MPPADSRFVRGRRRQVCGASGQFLVFHPTPSSRPAPPRARHWQRRNRLGFPQGIRPRSVPSPGWVRQRRPLWPTRDRAMTGPHSCARSRTSRATASLPAAMSLPHHHGQASGQGQRGDLRAHPPNGPAMRHDPLPTTPVRPASPDRAATPRALAALSGPRRSRPTAPARTRAPSPTSRSAARQ